MFLLKSEHSISETSTSPKGGEMILKWQRSSASLQIVKYQGVVLVFPFFNNS